MGTTWTGDLEAAAAPAAAHGARGGRQGLPATAPATGASLDLDGAADFLDLLLDVLGLGLRNAVFDRLGRTLDEVLGFLQTQSGDGAHDLDHLDLLRPGVGEDGVE